MKKPVVRIGAVLIALVVATFASVTAFALNRGSVLYTYNSAKASSEWKRYARGEWHYDKEGISCVNNDGRTGDDAWYYTYYGNKNGWKNYIVECDLNNVSEGGIIFRTTNPTDKTVDAFDGYYCGTDSDYIFFGMDENDKWKTIQTDGPDASQCYKIGYKAKMHWELHVEGNTFTLYLDGDKFPTAQIVDKGNHYSSGGIAIRYRVYPGDDSGTISNIKVTELTDKATTTTKTESTVSNASDKKDATTSNKESGTNESVSNSSTAGIDTKTGVESAEVQADTVDANTSDTSSSSANVNTVTDTVSETVDGKMEIPTLLWVLFGIMTAAFVSVPIVMIVIFKKSK